MTSLEAAALEALTAWVDLTAERPVIVREQDAPALTRLEHGMGMLAGVLERGGIDLGAYVGAPL